VQFLHGDGSGVARTRTVTRRGAAPLCIFRRWCTPLSQKASLGLWCETHAGLTVVGQTVGSEWSWSSSWCGGSLVYPQQTLPHSPSTNMATGMLVWIPRASGGCSVLSGTFVWRCALRGWGARRCCGAGLHAAGDNAALDGFIFILTLEVTEELCFVCGDILLHLFLRHHYREPPAQYVARRVQAAALYGADVSGRRAIRCMAA